MLDPEKPPTTLTEFADHARTIRSKVGGGEVMNEDGSQSTIDSPQSVEVGVAPIPGPDGGESTFVGGDSIGISATSKQPDAAWDFISWTLSDEAQIEVLAKNKDVLARPDLANNKYSSSDARIVRINELVGKGRTPYALNFATILIPLYVLLDRLGLQNSLVGLSLVFIMFQLPFALFMMRNSFEAVPSELEEAALVDGCSTFTALRRVLLRAVRPGLVTVGLFAFLASWNDFFAPLILISDAAKFTLPVAVDSMQQRTFGAIDYGALEAGVVVMALPCLVLFLLLQRHYVRGFMTGALRG